MRTLSTAAGTIIGVTVEKIDQLLSQGSSRAMFLEDDLDRVLDARLELMKEKDAS